MQTKGTTDCTEVLKPSRAWRQQIHQLPPDECNQSGGCCHQEYKDKQAHTVKCTLTKLECVILTPSPLQAFWSDSLWDQVFRASWNKTVTHTHETALFPCEQEHSQFQTDGVHVRGCVCSCVWAAVPWPMGGKSQLHTNTPAQLCLIFFFFSQHMHAALWVFPTPCVWRPGQSRVINRHGGRNWLRL